MLPVIEEGLTHGLRERREIGMSWCTNAWQIKNAWQIYNVWQMLTRTDSLLGGITYPKFPTPYYGNLFQALSK